MSQLTGNVQRLRESWNLESHEYAALMVDQNGVESLWSFFSLDDDYLKNEVLVEWLELDGERYWARTTLETAAGQLAAHHIGDPSRYDEIFAWLRAWVADAPSTAPPAARNR